MKQILSNLNDFLVKCKALILNHKIVFLSFLLTTLCASFHFWIAFPGYANWDTVSLIVEKHNLQPIAFYYLSNFLFELFGYHIYILLLLLIVPFYLSLWIIILAFYNRYHSWWVLLLLFPIFIQNIFVPLFTLLSTSFYFSFVFLIYSLIFYWVMNPATQKVKLLLFFILFLCALSIVTRHNGVVQILPVGIIGVYFYLKRRKILSKIRYYVNFVILSIVAMSIFLIVSFIPRFIPVDEEWFPEQISLANQLAGICVPANDSSCFDESWYIPGKKWEDLKKTYYRLPLDGNAMALYGSHVVMTANKKNEGMTKRFVKNIIKYPRYYFQHLKRLIASLWFSPMTFIEHGGIGPKSPFYEKFEFNENAFNHKKRHLSKKFPNNELYMHETPLKKEILHVWDDYFPHITTPTLLVFLLFFTLFSLGNFFFKKNKDLSFLGFTVSCGGLLSAVIYAGFYPGNATRYMIPVYASALITLYIFIVFILELFNKNSNLFNILKKYKWNIPYIARRREKGKQNIGFRNIDISKWLFIGCFLGCVSLPFLNNSEIKISDRENRTLNVFPTIFQNMKINQKFGLEFNDWLNDHIGYREKMIDLRSKLMYTLNGKIYNEKAFIGDEGWMFPTEGTKYAIPLIKQKKRINKIAHLIIDFWEYFKNENIPIYVIFKPNRISFLQKYWENYYPPSKILNIGQEVKQTLKNYHAIRVIDMTEEFYSNKNIQLYGKNDHHLTGKALDLIIEKIFLELKKDFPSLSNIKFTTEEKELIPLDWHSYYSRLLGLKPQKDTTKYQSRFYLNSNSLTFKVKTKAETRAIKENAPISKKLYMIFPCYGSFLFPVLSELFSETVHYDYYNKIGKESDEYIEKVVHDLKNARNDSVIILFYEDRLLDYLVAFKKMKDSIHK